MAQHALRRCEVQGGAHPTSCGAQLARVVHAWSVLVRLHQPMAASMHLPLKASPDKCVHTLTLRKTEATTGPAPHTDLKLALLLLALPPLLAPSVRLVLR